MIELHVALKQRDVAGFDQRLLDISTPGHALYGQHLDSKAIAGYLGASDEAFTTVSTWLHTGNITDIDQEHDWLVFRSTIAHAASLLSANFTWYSNNVLPESALRTLGYTLPPDVASHVDFVHPTIKFPASARRGQRGISAYRSVTSDSAAIKQPIDTLHPDNAFCNLHITPQCLLQLYNVHYGANKTIGIFSAFASFFHNYASVEDLDIFKDKVVPYAKASEYTVSLLNGASDSQTANHSSDESDADGQILTGVGWPLPVREYHSKGSHKALPTPGSPGTHDNEPYLRLLKYLLKLPTDQLPSVLSVSWGEFERSWPRPVALRICNMLGQVTARGTTVFFASGDNGPGADCQTPEGHRAFVPEFPQSCPYVTSVGGLTRVDPERAVKYSGGSFSDLFSRPSYQDAMVSRYLDGLGDKNEGLFNRSGRGSPDVSAQSNKFAWAWEGGLHTSPSTSFEGTSAACPTFAAVVNLLNLARASIGKPTLGWINPMLYRPEYAATFNDITHGYSVGCKQGGSNHTIPNAGWNTSIGWDAATGLGSPNFGKLLALLAPGVRNEGGPVTSSGP